MAPFEDVPDPRPALRHRHHGHYHLLSLLSGKFEGAVSLLNDAWIGEIGHAIDSAASIPSICRRSSLISAIPLSVNVTCPMCPISCESWTSHQTLKPSARARVQKSMSSPRPSSSPSAKG